MTYIISQPTGPTPRNSNPVGVVKMNKTFAFVTHSQSMLKLIRRLCFANYCFKPYLLGVAGVHGADGELVLSLESIFGWSLDDRMVPETKPNILHAKYGSGSLSHLPGSCFQHYLM